MDREGLTLRVWALFSCLWATFGQHDFSGQLTSANRHSHISTLLAQGVGVLVVAARVGHSSPKMTLDTYGHTSVADRHAVVDVLDKLARSSS
jgi:hypothetical protein